MKKKKANKHGGVNKKKKRNDETCRCFIECTGAAWATTLVAQITWGPGAAPNRYGPNLEF